MHARGIRDHTFHEVQVDQVGAKYEKNERSFIKRGTFADVENKLDDLKSQGVSALYLMGTLERDNGAFLNKYSDQIEYRCEDSSPLAVTSRNTANSMLGGTDALASLV